MSDDKKSSNDNTKKSDDQARKDSFNRTVKDLIQKGEEKKQNK